jgi:hypothetical protein
MTDVIYQEDHDRLIDICRQITSHRQMLAKPRIEQLILAKVDAQVANPQLLSHLIAESLMRRIDRQLVESKNIFVQEFDVPQTELFYSMAEAVHLIAESLMRRIDRQLVESKNIFVQEFDVPQTELFYSMAEAVPFVYVGHDLANQVLARAVRDLDSFTILDIGIGNGGQVKRLLDSLASGAGKLKSVQVIGMDPVEKNLGEAQDRLRRVNKCYPFDVRFQSLCTLVENLSEDDFRAIGEKSQDRLVINSAFAFHHTGHPLNDSQTRTDLLMRLASLQPLVLTLVEPNSNHDTEELTRRVHHSWEHFGNVFALVDEAGIDASHKYLIKGKFFAREIRDIFGVSDHFRCERHEQYDSWLLRLFKAGFKPVDLGAVSVKLPPYCQHDVSDGLVRLKYNDTTIVVMMAFSTSAA